VPAATYSILLLVALIGAATSKPKSEITAPARDHEGFVEYIHFAYEGRGNDARCIATWGDGGIYRRKLIYDTNNHTTIVTDSRDADTIYQMNADNAVVSVTDALEHRTV
jgi:hypothetical protein